MLSAIIKFAISLKIIPILKVILIYDTVTREPYFPKELTWQEYLANKINLRF
jgi:hypothetical protein